MNPNSAVVNLIRLQLRRIRRTPLVCALAAVLGAYAWVFATWLGWIGGSAGWALLPAVLSAVILGWWLRRTRRITEEIVARNLDGQWQLRSRLETAVELARDESAVAVAQRSDATQQVAGRGPTGAWAWGGGIALLLVVLVFLATESAVAVVRAVHARAAVMAEAKKAEEVRASIIWKSPEAESTATTIEEVPLTAYAESNKGFRTLSLEVDVNGENAPAQPLDVKAFAKPGGYAVETSLYLDELHVKAFDVVTYHLVGEPNTAQPNATVVSPLQFIQIRPPRRDLELTGGDGGGDAALISMIRQMKGAEIRLLQQNFTLLHADAVKRTREWKTANARVATEQAALAGQAGQAHDLAVEKKAPGLVTDNLARAEKLMKDAGERIAATDNDRATKPQHQVIGLLAAIEKLSDQALGGGAVTADPFHDLQNFELPPREATPAGELEKLALRQQQNNQSLNGEPAAEGTPGNGATGGGEQDAIARDATKLAQSGRLDPAVQKALEEAAASAALAARQLKANDRLAAREPAGAAQAGFEHAAAVQADAGNAATLVTLDQVRRALNAAGRESAATRTATLARVHEELRAAAIQQQRAGSADAARRLAVLAEAVNAPKGKVPEVPTSAPNTPERARELAAEATRAQLSFSPHGVALNRTVRELRHVQPLLAPGRDDMASAFADAELAGQEAEWLTTDTSIGELSRKLTARADALQRAGGKPGDGEMSRAAEAVATLALALEQARDLVQRDEIVRRFRAEDVDPEYRAAVEAYFERLSREGAKH